MKPFRGKRTGPQSRPGDSTFGARPGPGPPTRTGGGRGSRVSSGVHFPGPCAGTGWAAARRPVGSCSPASAGDVWPTVPGPAAWLRTAAPALRGPGARWGVADRPWRDCHTVPPDCPRLRPSRHSRAGRRGSPASQSAPRPTRLETRTKESCKCASHWAVRTPKAQ